MALRRPLATTEEPVPNAQDGEAEIRRVGGQLFDLMKASEPAWFHRQRLYAALMDWTMRDDHLKAQLFRFVDVLPTLRTAAEISRHFCEYLRDTGLALPPALRLAERSARAAPWLFGIAIKKQVAGVARQFMLGGSDQEIVRALRQREREGMGFTVDLLGETVVSEIEADRYAQRFLNLLDLLARELPHPASRGNVPRADSCNPRLNLSVKVSALGSNLQAADPDRAVERIANRLRPLLRRAKDAGALINFDMEQYALKELTLRLFKSLFGEQEFAQAPAAGLALQAYLKDSEQDLLELMDWAETHQRHITVRLVKGAYWDYEGVLASQKGWPMPVFTEKSETDSNYEKLSAVLLENGRLLRAAFGTHNVRSIAYALTEANRLGLDPSDFEFQMLYGMANTTKRALIQMGYAVREYCPVGELLPGMAYLVRRLLENTSNEGFLAQHHTREFSREELLQNPAARTSGNGVGHTSLRPARLTEQGGCRVITLEAGHDTFLNEPLTDFTIEQERVKIQAALQRVRLTFGQHHPLVINHRPVEGESWLPSLNPANQDEVIGYASQASVPDAETALAAARRAASGWARTEVPERIALLERVAECMRRDRSDLIALEILESGKSWVESDADVAEAIDFCQFYSAVLRDLGKDCPTQRVPGESNVQHWWPRGSGLIVAPWNFPLAILTGMTVAAVAAGNTVLMKPSDQTPVIGARLMDLLMEAGLPAGVANLVTGPGSTVGAHLVAHAKTDFIAFTGSKEVGLRIWEIAGRTLPGQASLKKVICEMGGKNAIIIDSDADLDEAVAGAVASAFGYSGQKCSALSRLIVLADAFPHFLDRLIAATASLPIGPAEDPGTVLGPVISRQAQERILQLIAHGKTEAQLAWEGRVPQEPNACYVPPTIFTEVPPHSRLFQEEIFGPVLSVTRATNFDQALALANASEFALTAGLYSRSPSNIAQAKAELVCGNLYINRPITGAIVGRQPFGGFKMSGTGTKAGGREYLENFMVPRVVTENLLRHGFAPSA